MHLSPKPICTQRHPNHKSADSISILELPLPELTNGILFLTLEALFEIPRVRHRA